MKFGQQLRRWRLELELTLKDVKKAAGLSIVQLSQVERGVKNPPSAEVLHKWLKLLGKEDQFEKMATLAARARKSLKISLTGHSESVVDMAGSLARRVECGDIDDDLAAEISLLLKRKSDGKKSSAGRSAK